MTTQVATQQNQETTIVDPDDAELAAALAAEQAEINGSAGNAADGQDPAPAAAGTAGDGQQGNGQQAAAPANGQPGPSDQQEERIWIPKQRFDAVLQAGQQWKDQATYYRGALEATRGGGANGQPGQQQAQPERPKDIPTQIAERRQQLLDAAAKYEAGDMSLVDYQRIHMQVDDDVAALRQQAFAAASTQAPQQGSRAYADQVLEDQHITRLEAEHDYLTHLKPEEFQQLQVIAMAEMAAVGKPYGTGLGETMRLREHVAHLSDQYGPVWHPNVPRRQRTQTPTNPAGSQGGLSPDAQARISKMNLAAEQPPNPHAMGGASNPSDLPTEEQLLSMNDEQIAALPASVQERLLSR